MHGTSPTLDDTDNDAVLDGDEVDVHGTSPTRTDTDRGGASDGLEVFRSDTDPTRAEDDVVDPTDRDGDGLYDCEELFLNSDPLNPDSDGDYLLDGLEFRYGLDPLVPDATEDSDVDGELNRAELRAGRDPLLPDFQARTPSIYRLSDLGEQVIEEAESGRLERRRCYDFKVRNIPLAVTRELAGRGRNRIYLHYLSQPVRITR